MDVYLLFMKKSERSSESKNLEVWVTVAWMEVSGLAEDRISENTSSYLTLEDILYL